MSDLDEKLRGIDKCIEVRVQHNPVGYDGAIIDARLKLTDGVIAQIKQAFADGGYLKHPQSVQENRDPLMWDRDRLLTGQEWLSRYKTEKGQGSLDNLKDMPHSKDYSDGIDHAVIKCDEAAERASGINEEQQNA